MKYLLFSDVHSNLEALEVLLVKITQEKPDKVIFLGDAVGYGADPSECLYAIAESADLILLGNHDAAAAGIISPVYFNPIAQIAILWTQSKLSKEEKRYLKNLPLILRFSELCLVHSSPYKPQDWNYILSLEDAVRNFPYFSSPLCFIGHSHRPGMWISDQSGKFWLAQENELKVEENYKYIINVGSVGQPRDRNSMGAYCIYDDQKQIIQINRFTYNIQKAQKKILQAGLPQFLAERLSTGI